MGISKKQIIEHIFVIFSLHEYLRSTLNSLGTVHKHVLHDQTIDILRVQ